MTKQNDFLFSVPFNLTRSGGNVRISGELILRTDSVVVIEDGEKKEEIPICDIEEFNYDAGVGCSSIEARLHTRTVILARGDMSLGKNLSTAYKRLNRYLGGGKPDEEWKHFEKTICPKCKRPFPPGTELCPRCADKKGYLKRLWQIARPFKWWIFVSVALYFLIAGAGLIGPYLNRILVDDYIKADTMPLLSQFLLVILMMLAVDFLIRLLSIGRGYIQIICANKVIVRLREMIFRKIEELSIAGVSKRTSGELINNVTSDTNQLRVFISDDFGNLVENMVTILAVGIMLFTFDWRLALIILVPAPLVMLAHRYIWKYLSRGFHVQWAINHKVNTILHDIFSGIRVVKCFGMEKGEFKRYDEAAKKEREMRTRNEKNYAYISPITSFLIGVGEFFLLYYVGNKIIDGEMTLGQMQQFSAYAAIIYGPLRWLASLPRRLANNMVSMVKIFNLLDEKPDVTDKEKPLETELTGNIDISNVSFGYEDSRNVLKNVSLSIKTGEMIGIVGRSGVGKSTLINLLMRLYDAEDGSITFDGIDIRDISQECLRRQMGVVLQETLLFSGTLIQNIAYGKPGATKEEILTASKLSGVHQFAIKLPYGYNTVVGEKGYTLSGGERQRVAIARALLHNPKILILDEATSSLDTETEKDIQDVLQRLTAGRTTIAIAHRLSTLRNATRLVVLDKGTVAEVGTHGELMRLHGLYYELVMAQRQMSKMQSEDKEQKNAAVTI